MPTDEITPREAARLLGVSARTVTRYGEAGLLPMRKLPSGFRRFERADVIALRDRADRESHPPGAA